MSSRKRWHLIFVMEENKTTKICSFFGAEALPYLYDGFNLQVCSAIMGSFEDGCHTFYFGGQGEFEAICHRIVTAIKEGHAPYISVDRIFCVKEEEQLQAQRRDSVPERYEDVVYLSPSPTQKQNSSYARNCAMIDASDTVIFCVEEKGNSSASRAYKYAQMKGKKIVNLWEKYAPVLVPRDVARHLLNRREGVFSVD